MVRTASLSIRRFWAISFGACALGWTPVTLQNQPNVLLAFVEALPAALFMSSFGALVAQLNGARKDREISRFTPPLVAICVIFAIAVFSAT